MQCCWTLVDTSKQTPEPTKLMQRTPSASAAKSRPPFARGVSTPEPADELIMSTSKPFFRLAVERKEQEDAIKH
uniref:Uncharacterized protein n=1 Tax=Ditylenchus dipsaci TaxID=166011 RepID=A0A915CUV8_9BILA